MYINCPYCSQIFMKTNKQHNIPYINNITYCDYFHVCLKIFKIVMK